MLTFRYFVFCVSVCFKIVKFQISSGVEADRWSRSRSHETVCWESVGDRMLKICLRVTKFWEKVECLVYFETVPAHSSIALKDGSD